MSRERNLFIKSGRLGKRNKYIYRLVSLLSLSLSLRREHFEGAKLPLSFLDAVSHLA